MFSVDYTTFISYINTLLAKFNIFHMFRQDMHSPYRTQSTNLSQCCFILTFVAFLLFLHHNAKLKNLPVFKNCFAIASAYIFICFRFFVSFKPPCSISNMPFSAKIFVLNWIFFVLYLG